MRTGDDRATVRLNVDEAVWQRLAQERAKEDSDLKPGYHAAVTCMNGQTVLANGGSQKRFISTMIPVVGDAVPRPLRRQPVSDAVATITHDGLSACGHHDPRGARPFN